MLKVALIDANEKTNREYAGIAASVVSGWLTWEAGRSGIELCSPPEADIILLVFAGALDWLSNCKTYLRRYAIEPDCQRRKGKPYIITGGPIDAAPLTALSIADALAVGEGVRFVRALFDLVRGGKTISDIRSWIVAYPHAIEVSQIVDLRRDPERPWLLDQDAPKLASPDDYVDWSIPPIRSDDKVVRIIAEKGCHCKCAFCATTYRQTHRQNPDGDNMLSMIRGLKKQGERVQIISNDPMNLPYFRRINTRPDSQSFTIMEVSDPANLAAIIRSGVGIARFGVEGISERIRKAFAKPITNDHLLDILATLHKNKINTHLFFITGAPGESAQDWQEFRDFYWRLANTIHNNICRIKFTTFVNTPPAPLARFVPGGAWEKEMDEMRRWISTSAASRHLIYIRGRRGKTHIADVAEQLSISNDLAAKITNTGRDYDLLPTLDAARRAPWEIIEWPISVETRYRISEIYKRRMDIQ